MGKAALNKQIKEVNYVKERKKDWGIAYRKASEDFNLAIETLLKNKKGFVPKAFYKEGVGYIDLVWGDSRYGLQHIIKRRNAQGIEGITYIKNLPNLIRRGKLVDKGHPSRKYIIDDKSETVIRLDFNYKERKWIVSSYYQYEKMSVQASSGLRPLNETYVSGQVISPPNLNRTSTDIIPNQTEHLNPSKWLTDENNQARLTDGISKVFEIETFKKTEDSKEQEINNNDASFFKFLDTLDNVSNSLMYKPDMSELFNNEDEDDNDYEDFSDYDDYDKEENDVSGIEYVEVIENKKEVKEDMNKPLFKLRISEYEVLEFNTKEDYINYIGTILAKEIKKAVENRDYSDKYFKPARV